MRNHILTVIAGLVVGLAIGMAFTSVVVPSADRDVQVIIDAARAAAKE